MMNHQTYFSATPHRTQPTTDADPYREQFPDVNRDNAVATEICERFNDLTAVLATIRNAEKEMGELRKRFASLTGLTSVPTRDAIDDAPTYPKPDTSKAYDLNEWIEHRQNVRAFIDRVQEIVDRYEDAKATINQYTERLPRILRAMHLPAGVWLTLDDGERIKRCEDGHIAFLGKHETIPPEYDPGVPF